MKYRKTRYVKKALKEINYLLTLAEKAALENDLEWSRKLVMHALRFSMKTNVRIPRDRKYYICKKCGSYLIPGKNATVRLHVKGRKSYITIRCLTCGAIKRMPYKPRKRVSKK